MPWNELWNRWKIEMTASFSTDGRLYTVRFERQLSHSQEKVWGVLTERELLKQWFPCEIVGEWKVGAKLEFPLEGQVAEGAKEEDFHGGVLAVEPPRLLEYRWGRDILRYELNPEGDGCRLVFLHSFEDKSTAARNAAGWEWCFANMDSALAAQPPVEFDMETWGVLFERYVAEFEPQAGSQQGPPSSSE